eukprot:TRINITY_DN55322_c0_g1_i1.p1 TRINITY_DN55322_c0_g1~~TRINITY_DN55322_c0_g1_i1.p1  ORF type:complete len:749 (-),score=93.13 TRINITY_DN55322_c0_g1_i1:196-2442(-)
MAALSPRLPPPVLSFDPSSSTDVEGSASASLETLRAEAGSLAKARRNLGNRLHAVPKAAGKLQVSMSRAAAASAGYGGQAMHPAPRSDVGDEELSGSVVPPQPARGHSSPGAAASTARVLQVSTVSPRSEWTSQAAVLARPGDSLESHSLSCLSGVAGHAVAPPNRQNAERRQLVEWGESLYREVGRLEEENAQFRCHLGESQAELEQARRRCSELERRLSKASPRDVSENADLRKQLAAYAVEIDVLREEKDSCETSLKEAQDAVHRLSVERENFVRSLQDLEWKQHDKAKRCDELEQLLNDHLGHKHAVEGQLRSAMSELNVVGASLQLAHERGSATMTQAEKAVADAERSSTDKDKTIAALIDVIQPLKDLLNTLQDSFVKQTREFHSFVKQVRQKQHTVVKDIDAVGQALTTHWEETQELPQQIDQLSRRFTDVEARHQRAIDDMSEKHQCLQEEVGRAQQEHAFALEESQRSMRELKSRNDREMDRKISRNIRHRRMFNPNIGPQMLMACEGVIMQKVQKDGSKKEHRKVVICADSMRLKWVKHPFKFGKGESFVDLDRLVYIGFGCMTRAHQLFPMCQPWFCFSVHTLDRSYDFICRDEREAEVFVVTISRLCARCNGWPLPGSIQTHGRFVSATAWSKVESYCKKERKTLCNALMDAMAVAAANPRPATQADQVVPQGGVVGRTASLIPTGSPSLRSAAGAPGRTGDAGALGTGSGVRPPTSTSLGVGVSPSSVSRPRTNS